jgi:hypothetical protein
MEATKVIGFGATTGYREDPERLEKRRKRRLTAWSFLIKKTAA